MFIKLRDLLLDPFHSLHNPLQSQFCLLIIIEYSLSIDIGDKIKDSGVSASSERFSMLPLCQDGLRPASIHHVIVVESELGLSYRNPDSPSYIWCWGARRFHEKVKRSWNRGLTQA